jgi:hypothetical protein
MVLFSGLLNILKKIAPGACSSTKNKPIAKTSSLSLRAEFYLLMAFGRVCVSDHKKYLRKIPQIQ